MLAIACPSCGAPCRVSLAKPDEMRCEKCGRRHAPSERDRVALRAAAAVVEELEREGRQLRGLDRLLASRTSGALVAIAVATVLAAGWSALVAAGAAAHVFAHDGTARALYAGSAAAVTMLVAVPALVWTIVSARRLRAAARAVPPIQPGEPAECRVCGGPLTTDEGVVRCAHCGADNVVDADVLRRAGAVREAAIEDLADVVRESAASVAETRTLAIALVVALSLFAVPLFTIATGQEVAKRAGVAFASDARWYGFECARDPHVLCFVNTPLNPPPTCAPAEPMSPSVLVGKRVVRSDVVVATEHNFFFGDVAALDSATGRVLVPLDGVCVESPPGASFTKWLTAREKANAGKRFVFENGTMVATDAGPPPIEPETYCQDYVDFTFDCGFAGGDRGIRASTVGNCLQGLSPFNKTLIACYVQVMDIEDDARACAEYEKCASAPAARDAGR